MRLYWLFQAFLASALLAAIHILALHQSWYWTYRWLDIPMHVLGGFALGSLLVAFLFRFRPAYYIAGMCLVAVSWEVFESILILPHPADYAFDTAKDLLDDVLGAVLAYSLAKFTIWRSV